jgi:hypothetical protein
VLWGLFWGTLLYPFFPGHGVGQWALNCWAMTVACAFVDTVRGKLPWQRQSSSPRS